MNWWLPHNFNTKKTALRLRSRALKTLRDWFDGQKFDEVQTPILQICPVMDAHIHGFATDLMGPDLQHKRTLYLHTSPEFAMKKLLTAGCERIYQVAPVFRNGDDSRLHSPEFTLLEWYRTGTDYRAMMDDCEALLAACAQSAGVETFRYGDKSCATGVAAERISVAEAFDRYAGIDLDTVLEDVEAFQVALKQAGIRSAPDDGWDDLFFRVMAEKIEPYLGHGAPSIIYDYPVCLASLARRSPADPRYAERFELYVCGVELANAFSELTDASEQRARYEAEMALKERLYGRRYPLDEDFIAALEHGMPESSGCALGFDRLVMLLAGVSDIKQVLWSPVEA